MAKTSESKKGLGTFSTLSIGIGGMVGGGIFAVTGLSIEIARGSAPIAFGIAGIVALLTGYSYLKLTLKYPGEGGTVSFLNKGFGTGTFTGGLNILLLFSYVVLVSVYAYAFGGYGSSFFPEADQEFWRYTLTTGIIVLLLFVNAFGGKLVIRSENLFNALKMIILLGFIIFGLTMDADWTRIEPENYVSPLGMISGAMLIFLNYEGFELIANASGEVANRKKTLPIAYIGGILIAMIFYLLIVSVVIGHLNFNEIALNSVNSLSVAAEKMLGKKGFIAIAIAALLATSSAINATFYSTGSLTNTIAQSGELPSKMEATFRGQHLVGTIFTAGLAIIVANFIPLEAIATMGSAGFLLIFMMVNIANVRLAKETGSLKWLSGLAAIMTAFALIILCIKVDENPATKDHLWILAGMIVLSFVIEKVYRTKVKKVGSR
ncbi:APC family permease [Bizionia arctica]|uniref:Amino acid transporter n=1 Tax=Bizionia arctica TaxID=1495645 RepID=A0A917LNF2_9FLAO|nr:APC family permease [Bizionia arctica]GGG47572.1 amino acid transporter [Bizionia arctica]